MSYYGGTVTVAGRNLITSLIAGETIQFTKVQVGTGAVPEGTEILDMTALVEPKCLATSTTPVAENGYLSMTVEYRNDMNDGLKEGFWLREFGIFAKTERQPEILFYYATLGDSPQPVSPYKENRVDIRRYPLTIALAVDAKVQVLYDTNAFLTSKDAQTIISSMITQALTSEVCHAVTTSVAIPNDGWKKCYDEGDNYGYDQYRDVEVTEATEAATPYLSIDLESLNTATTCGFCPTMETMDGKVRFYAVKAPDKTITGSLQLFFPGNSDTAGMIYEPAIATKNSLGVVKIGNNIQVMEDGTIYVDSYDAVDEILPSDQEMDDMIDGVFGEDDV